MSTSHVPGSGPGRKSPGIKAPRAAAATSPTIPRRRNPKGKRYPVWSVRWLFAAFIIGVILTVVLVLLFGEHRQAILQMEITLTAVALFMFAFLAVGLYYGARIRKKEKVHGDLQLVNHGDVFKDNAGGCLDIADFSSIGDGCGEAIGGLIAGIVLLVLLIIGIWLFINVGLIVIFLLAIAVGWIFHRAIRQVFSKSRRCRGDLVNSLFYAAVYTILYTGWLFIILWATDYLMRNHKRPPIAMQENLKAAQPLAS